MFSIGRSCVSPYVPLRHPVPSFLLTVDLQVPSLRFGLARVGGTEETWKHGKKTQDREEVPRASEERHEGLMK